MEEGTDAEEEGMKARACHEEQEAAADNKHRRMNT